VTTDPPERPSDPGPDPKEPERDPGPERDPEPEPWQPATDPRLPVPRAELRLKLSMATKDSAALARSLANELEETIDGATAQILEIFTSGEGADVAALSISMLLSTTAVAQLAALLNSWLSRRQVRSVSIFYESRHLMLEEAPVDASRIASLIFDRPA
jgi:hypothetical protein